MDFTEMETRKLIRKTRHKAEMPLRIIAITLSSLVYAIAGFFGIALKMSPELYNEVIATCEGDESSIMMIDLCKNIGFGCVILIMLFFLVMFLLSMYKQYAQEMSYSVRVSEKNFPEIYAKSVEFSEKLGLKKVPEIYVTQCNGVLNAFATMVPHKRYIQLNAEMVDVAYMENKDFDAVYFTMAHEFGHIYFHHVTLQYHLFTVFFNMLPFFGPLLSRAMEYSCDRVAQALTDNNGAVSCMMLIGAGRHLYKYVDPDAYLEKALGKYRFFERLFRFFVNLNATHPIACFRVKAIMDPERKSGRLL